MHFIELRTKQTRDACSILSRPQMRSLSRTNLLSSGTWRSKMLRAPSALLWANLRGLEDVGENRFEPSESSRSLE
jgi:hypothetical protein